MLYDINKRNKRKSMNPGFWKGFSGQDVLSDFNVSEAEGPATNVIENEKEYILEVATPGMCKQDFSIELKNDILTITGEKPASNDINYTRYEFDMPSFEKSFIMPENIKNEEVAASCSDGILTINVPKKTNVISPQKKTITVH